MDESGVHDPEVEEEARDLEGMVHSFEAQAVSDADVKYMKQRAYATNRGRRASLRRFRRE